MVNAAAAVFRTTLGDVEGPLVDIELYRVMIPPGADSPCTADESRARGGCPVRQDTRLDQSLEGAHFLVAVTRGELRNTEGIVLYYCYC